MRKAVSIFLDIEDPINPLSDDAARDLVQVFDDEQTIVCLCITGEKCRTLLARGRYDIIDLMRPHCLGLHTDTHSCHPTTMELLADLSYEEGCEAAYRAELKGAGSFEELFGSKPIYWGGAAFTWSPEINYALRKLGIPSYIYSLTSTPNRGVHRFDGIVAFPHGAMVHEVDWAEDGSAAAACSKALAFIRETPQPWVSLLVGHPTKFRHKQYWDTPYFHGRTPPGLEYVEPVDPESFERSRTNLRRFVHSLKDEFEIIGLDDVLAWPWKYRPANDVEMRFFEDQTPERIRSTAKWCVHHDGLDPENMVQKTLALKSTLEIASL